MTWKKLLFCLLLFCNSMRSQEPIRILSLDGGGIRGIIEAVILRDLEKELNKPISQIFDLIAGSSTGGVIALGLSVPSQNCRPLYSAEDLLDVYLEHGDQVFHASFCHRLRTLGGLIGPKYESKSLKNLLAIFLGDTKLSEALIPILITGYHVAGEIGIEFFSEDARRYPENIDCYMKDLGLATAAAPIFFDTPNLELASITLHAVADGGLYKNNPALLGYINAKKLYPERIIQVYSLGTGKISTEEFNKDLSGRGLIHWLPPIIYHSQIGDIEGDNVILHRLLNEEGEENFFRLDIKVDREHRKMDDISEENLNYLIKKGQEALQTGVYKRMLEKLKTNK